MRKRTSLLKTEQKNLKHTLGRYMSYISYISFNEPEPKRYHQLRNGAVVFLVEARRVVERIRYKYIYIPPHSRQKVLTCGSFVVEFC